MADPTQFDQFRQLLTDSQTLGNRENYEKLTPQREALEKILQPGIERENAEKMIDDVRQLARNMRSTGLLPSYLTPEQIGETFDPLPYLKHVPPTRETEAPLPPTLAAFLPKGDTFHGGGRGHGSDDPKTDAENAFKLSLKEATLKAFQELLDTTPDDQLPGVIEEFYHKHLSAVGILGNQYDILLAQTRKLYGDEKEFAKHEDTLLALRNDAVTKAQDVFDPLPTQAEHDKHDRNLHKLTEGAPTRKQLVERAENIFDEGWKNDALEKFIDTLSKDPLFNFDYQTSYEEGYRLYAGTVFQTTQQTEEPPIAIPQGNPGGAQQENQGNGLGNIVGGGAKNLGKNLLKKGGEQALEGAARAGATAAADAAADAVVATAPEWLPPVLIALGIILAVFLLVVFVVIFLQQFTNSNTTNQQATLQPGCSPSSSCAQLLQSAGFSLQGDLSLNGDPYGKAKLAYDTLANAEQSPSQYGVLLGANKQQITLDFLPGGCAGHASTDGTVKLYGFGACGTGVAKFMLLHELSHEIAFRNPSLYNKFSNQFPLPVLIFYKLPTFNCELDYGPGGPFPAECFADTLAEYVVYKTYRNTVSGPFGVRLPLYYEAVFSSFPTAFAPFYNFAKDNVYGGLTF